MVKKEVTKTTVNVEDLPLTLLKGLGATAAERFEAIGIKSILDLAVSNAPALNTIMPSMTNETAIKYILMANQYLKENGVIQKELPSCNDLYNYELTRERCSTGSKELDNILGGGIETRSVTEFYGEFGSGKTQVCLSTAVIATQPKEKGGLNGDVLWVDTENTFSPSRINDIAVEKGFNNEEVRNKIHVLSPNNVSLLTLYMDHLQRYIKSNNVRLIVVDSIIALHRAEFLGRGQLQPRQQSLNNILNKLVKSAHVYDIAIIITNQVIDSPDPYNPGIKATGGNIMAHASTHRIYLKKKPAFTMALMVDSPRYAKIECRVGLSKSGIIDVDEKGKPIKDGDIVQGDEKLI